MLPLQSVGRSNFDKGLHIITTTLIKKRHIIIRIYIYIYCYILLYILLCIYIVDVVPLTKTAGVVENYGHCIYSIGLKCFRNCLSLFHLVFYIYIYIYVYIMHI